MAVHRYARTGRWVAQHYDPKTGKRKQVGTFDTKREAVAALERYRRALEARAGVADLTIAEWRQRWLDESDWALSTRRHNTERTQLLVDLYGDLPLRDFGVSMARRWQVEQPSKVNAVAAMFAAAAREVDDQDRPLLMFSPFSKLQRKRPRAKRELPDEWLPLAEVQRIQELAAGLFGPWSQTAAAIWRFAAETGIRPGELYTLEMADLNTQAGELTIRRSVDSKSGMIGPPKGGRSVKEAKARVVVLSSLAAELAEQSHKFAGPEGQNPVLLDQRGRPLPWSGRGTPRLFSTPQGRMLRTQSWSYYWHQIRAAAGRPGMDFYEARHFCCTRLIELGLSYEDVANQLGHSDTKLVQEVYGHPSKRKSRERVREALDNDNREAA